MILGVAASRCPTCEDWFHHGTPLGKRHPVCNGSGWVLPEHVVVSMYFADGTTFPRPDTGTILAAVKKCENANCGNGKIGKCAICGNREGGRAWLVVGVYGVVTEALPVIGEWTVDAPEPCILRGATDQVYLYVTDTQQSEPLGITANPGDTVLSWKPAAILNLDGVLSTVHDGTTIALPAPGTPLPPDW